MVTRPDWWTYPAQCRRGHDWAPGRVIVAWTPCGCQGGRGHERVHCGTDGCRETWYRPRHDPAWQPAGYPAPTRR